MIFTFSLFIFMKTDDVQLLLNALFNGKLIETKVLVLTLSIIPSVGTMIGEANK